MNGEILSKVVSSQDLLSNSFFANTSSNSRVDPSCSEKKKKDLYLGSWVLGLVASAVEGVVWDLLQLRVSAYDAWLRLPSSKEILLLEFLVATVRGEEIANKDVH